VGGGFGFFALVCVEVEDEAWAGIVLVIDRCVVGGGVAGSSIVACVDVGERRHFGWVDVIWFEVVLDGCCSGVSIVDVCSDTSEG
jgi:hypothetical protein